MKYNSFLPCAFLSQEFLINLLSYRGSHIVSEQNCHPHLLFLCYEISHFSRTFAHDVPLAFFEAYNSLERSRESLV